jgi:integrase/recombinase XerD
MPTTLKTICPSSFWRYSTLKILGPIVDGFATWLLEQRYNVCYLKCRICLLPYIETVLLKRGIQHVSEIGSSDWAASEKSVLRRFPGQSGITYALQKYLHFRNFLKPTEQKETSTAKYLALYAHYLKTVRGTAVHTIKQNSWTAAKFLEHLSFEKHPRRLKMLSAKDVEVFVKKISRRCSRASVRCIAGRIRSFLRFLAFKGAIPHGLDLQIDTPRVYRAEQLPRALGWETVETFLNSIDRSDLAGLRDFTMFYLMAIYGLRASDISALTLDHIQWRAGKICLSQRKTGTALELPLTDAVGTALYSYLKKVVPPPSRHLFFRFKAPVGALTTSAVSTRFRMWARRSETEMPGWGSCHRIRHSYAVFLLRSGTAVKTISDILGHRTLESTSTYLRLAIEDLRDVALPVPTGSQEGKAVRA